MPRDEMARPPGFRREGRQLRFNPAVRFNLAECGKSRSRIGGGLRAWWS